MAQVRTNLAAIRKSRGVAASELARRVGVSRQTIYSIEAGAYLPKTEVTLRAVLCAETLPAVSRARTV